MKTLYVIIACVVVAGLVGSGLWFGVVTPTQKKLAVVKNESALCDSLATVNDSINAELQAKVTKAQDNAGYWEDRNDEKIAELDTIRPKALIADSLAAVVATLQAENAALAAAKAKPASKSTTTTATATVAKATKGNPAIDHVTKTFTYVASDSALIAKLCPKGFALVKKPR